MKIKDLTSSFKEIEFVCVNSNFESATHPESQKKLFKELQKIKNVIVLLQDWSDDDEQQISMSAIYSNPADKSKILKAAKKCNVEVDIIRDVDNMYVHTAITGNHDCQIQDFT